MLISRCLEGEKARMGLNYAFNDGNTLFRLRFVIPYRSEKSKRYSGYVRACVEFYFRVSKARLVDCLFCCWDYPPKAALATHEEYINWLRGRQ